MTLNMLNYRYFTIICLAIENKVENVSKETPTQAPNEPFGSQDHETVNRPLTSTLRRYLGS